jgi:hypothetical protein
VGSGIKKVQHLALSSCSTSSITNGWNTTVGLGDNESCGACELTGAGSVTHSVRLRSSIEECRKAVKQKKVARLDSL